jgi:hypothetical protein
MATEPAKQPGQIDCAGQDLNGPEPARVYERAHPANEGGMGRMDNNKAIPEPSPDHMEQAVTHRQPSRQINADDVVDGRASRPAAGVRVNGRRAQRADASDAVAD